MALIGYYTDPHFSVTGSILNGRSGYKYSQRLDYLVQSFKWMYEEFKNKEVDLIVCGGDLLDSDIIKSEEGSALSEALSYNNDIPEYFLLGNHEKRDDAGVLNSLALLKNFNNRIVVDKPIKIFHPKSTRNLCFLPYSRDIESCYESVDSMIINISNDGSNAKDESGKILFSHMNFNGMSIGKSFVFDDGLDMNRFTDKFDLIINGHIHNSASYCNGKIINAGSLFGTGFGDSYTNNYPGITIIDTETLKLTHIDNPYAVTFHQIKVVSIGELIKEVKSVNKTKNPKCLRIEVPYLIRDEAREYIDNYSSRSKKILAVRIQGKIENSSVLKTNTDECDDIERFESSGSAMLSYLTTIDEASMPSTKDKMVKFINDYLL